MLLAEESFLTLSVLVGSEVVAGESAPADGGVGGGGEQEGPGVDVRCDLQFEHSPVHADVALNGYVKLAVGEEAELAGEVENARGGVGEAVNFTEPVVAGLKVWGGEAVLQLGEIQAVGEDVRAAGIGRAG